MTLTEQQVVLFERTAFMIDLVAAGLAAILDTIQICTRRRITILNPGLAFFIHLLQPFNYFVSIGSIVGCVEFLSKGTVMTPLFSVARSTQAFGGNMVKVGMLVICCDRIISTIYLESYHRWAAKRFGFLLCIITIMISCLVILTPHICKFSYS